MSGEEVQIPRLAALARDDQGAALARDDNERSRRQSAGFSVMRRRTDYLRREVFFAAFLRAPPFFAPFFADDLRAAFFAPFFRAAMVISDEGVERSIEPPVVRTSQWLDA